MRSPSPTPFPYLQTAVASRLLLLLLDLYLQSRQILRYSEHTPTPRVAALVPARKFLRAQAYGRARGRFSAFNGAFHGALSLAFTLSLAHAKLWALARRIARVCGRGESELWQALAFFVLLGGVELVLDLPAAAYSTFVVEARFGFNRTSVRTFVRDTALSAVLAAAVGLPAVAALHLTLVWFAATPPLVVAAALWALVAAVLLFMMFLVPSVIAPMFNTFVPLEEGPLRDSVRALAAQVRFPLGKVYVVDGTRRSSHSNAYFAGLFSKFICIYDSLLQQTKGHDEQVVAVLCHELGHWACSHTVLGVVLSLAHLGVFCVLYGFTAGNPDLYRSFGYVDGTMPKIIGLVLFSEMLTPIDAVLKPLGNVISRRFEYQADKFAKDRGMGKALAQALVAMHVNNLSNMAPDPLFAMWNYSHPTLLERLDALDVEVELETKGSGAEGEKED